MAELVAAVDVGTGSARAGVFDARGRMLGRAEHPIALREPGADRAEQDSEDIWRAAGAAMRAARAEAGAAAAAIAGLGFDATCSLVLRDRDGAAAGRVRATARRAGTPCSGSTIARATEAAACTATGARRAATCRRRDVARDADPEADVAQAAPARDLGAARPSPSTSPTSSTWKATGSTARSICTLACKWGYLGHAPPAWRPDFLDRRRPRRPRGARAACPTRRRRSAPTSAR